MALDIWEQIRRGQFPQTGPTVEEVLCAVGRQLGFRLERIIDAIQNGPAPGLAPISGPGGYTPIGRLVELVRLSIASYPRDHNVVPVTIAATLLISNPLPMSIPVMVTNLDNAQLLFYGSATVAVTTAPIIDPQTSRKIVISPSSDLFGIVIGPGNVNVGLSNLDLPTV